MKLRKWVSLGLSLTMVLMLLAACSSGGNKDSASQDTGTAEKGTENTEKGKDDQKPQESNFNDSGMPIVKQPVTVKVFAGKPPASSDWDKVMLWKEYEKMSNVHIEWVQQVPFANVDEKRNLMMANGEYPDALYASIISPADTLKYGSEGVLLKLNDLIDKYAPNLKKLFDEHPEIRKGVTMADGNIYSFPTIAEPDFMSVRIGGRTWFKKSWMDQLGIAEPQTPDDFYNMLKTIKEKDPAGGGKTVPFASFGGFDPLLNYLMGAWGLYNHGVANVNLDVDPDTGKLRFIPADPKYKEVLQFANKLFSEKLLWDNFLEGDYAKIIAAGSTGNFFSVYSQDPKKVFNQDGYVGAPALKNPGGEPMYEGVTSPILWQGGLVLTKNLKNPEVMVRWMDHMYGDEGSKMFFMGFEGVTYEKKADGSLDYLDSIKNPTGGLNFDQAVSQYLTWPGGGYASIVRKAFFKGSEATPASMESAAKLEPFLPKEIWATFNYTPEENEILATVGNDIYTYLAEMKLKFITGKTPLTEWDQYINQLNKMGLDKLMGVYEAAYERYKQ